MPAIQPVKGTRLRATKIDSCGRPIAGPRNRLVTSGYVSLTLTPVMREAQDLTQDNAEGKECFSDRTAPQRRWYTPALELCNVNTGLLSMFTGWETLLDLGATPAPVGFRDQKDVEVDFGIALERADDTVFLSFFPQFWIAGENLGIIFPVFCGATLVLLTRWDPVAVMTAVQQYQVTCMAMPVDGAVELMDHPRFGDFDLSSLRQVRVVSFVKKLNLDYRRRWQQLTGGILAEAAWGMTETHTSDTFTTGFQGDDYDLHAQPVFVGLPVPGTEFKICDFETGALKPLGEDGEIRVRTPSLLKGYWNRPDAAANASEQST